MLASFKNYFNSGFLTLSGYEQGWGELAINKDFTGAGPVKIAGKEFATGVTSHANCHIDFNSARPLRHFRAYVGVSDNVHTQDETRSIAPIQFTIESEGHILGACDGVTRKELALLECDIPDGVFRFSLCARTENIQLAHASFADVRLTFGDGSVSDPFEQVQDFDMSPALVSFQYGDMDSLSFFHAHPLRLVESCGGTPSTFTMQSEGEGLQVSITLKEYGDASVWEWHTTLKNIGKGRTPRVSKVHVLNFATPLPNAEFFTVHRRRGSYHYQQEGMDFSSQFINSYRPVVDTLKDLEHIEMRNENGRPTEAWLPCVDVTNDQDESIRFVLGWAGQWRMSLERTCGTRLSIRGGLEDFDSVLEEGEEVTLPSVFLLRDGCNLETLVNKWRRFVTQHVMAPINGKPPKSQVFFNHWGGMSAEEQMERARDIVEHNMPCDTYWIDAGWYAPHSKSEFEPVWCRYVGDWVFQKEQYPNEMRELSDYLHQHGKKLLLWFEPERAVATSQLAQQHPEWLIELPGQQDRLLNFGNEDAWNWCYDTISGIIRRNKLDWFREDFNISPLPYWRKNDQPDRRGMTEVRFVEGVYRFWKRLRQDFPDLMIDNCSSGGRRLDVELLRYSVPLWPSDMQCGGKFDPEWSLAQCVWLGSYWPLMATSTGNHLDQFMFRSALCSSIDVHYCYNSLEEPSPDYPYEVVNKNIQEHKAIQDLIGCDFYELSPYFPHGNPWGLFQYDSPEAKQGAIFAFRSPNSCISEYEIRPRNLKPDALYEVSDMDGYITPCRMTGIALSQQGIPLRLPPRTSAILQYKQIDN